VLIMTSRLYRVTRRCPAANEANTNIVLEGDHSDDRIRLESVEPERADQLPLGAKVRVEMIFTKEAE